APAPFGAPAAGFSTRERSVDALCILVTPLVQVAMNQGLFVTPQGAWIDPWVYAGCFLDVRTNLQTFGNTYYVTRLSWILPGALVHGFLPPVAASYVLHLGFFYALVFATYTLVRSGAGRNAAILVTLVMAWSPLILASQSWDYVDGAGIAFQVITLMCLEKAAAQAQYRWAWALAAGAAMACM